MSKIYLLRLTQLEFCDLRYVLVHLCCHKLPEISGFQQHNLLYHSSLNPMSGGLGQFSLLWVSQGQYQGVSRVLFLSFSSISLGETPIPGSFRLLPNSVTCSCRTEVPVSLLAVSQGSFSAARSHLNSLTCGPFLQLQIQQGWVESFSHLISF